MAVNASPVDRFTLAHLGVGVLGGLVGVPRLVALGAAVAYELAEQAWEGTPAGQRFFGTSAPESLANALVDVAVYAVG